MHSYYALAWAEELRNVFPTDPQLPTTLHLARTKYMCIHTFLWPGYKLQYNCLSNTIYNIFRCFFYKSFLWPHSLPKSEICMVMKFEKTATFTVCYHCTDFWLWHVTGPSWWGLLCLSWRTNSSEVDCSWGYYIQKVLNSKWRVELWLCAVWDMESGT